MSESRICRYCGSSQVEVTQRTITCQRCHMKSENTPPTERKNKRRRGAGPSNTVPPKQATPTPAATTTGETVEDGWQDLVIRDYVEYRDEQGELVSEQVQEIPFRIPPSKYQPDLVIDAAKAEFFKHLFRKQLQKDRRWGRDNLKARGLVPTEQVEDRGKVVTKWELPSEK